MSALEFENKTKGKVVSSERTEYSIPWHPKRNSARTGPNRLEPVGTWLQPGGPERRGLPDDEIV